MKNKINTSKKRLLGTIWMKNYLNLYCFMNSGHKNKLEKVEEILSLSTQISINVEIYLNKPPAQIVINLLK